MKFIYANDPARLLSLYHSILNHHERNRSGL
jgi:hypothetical protein